MPVLTVIMPVYNGERFIKESIDSVLNQTFSDFKLLVLNDNSTDNTAAILESYERQDERVAVITKTKNEGPANLRNEGIEKSKTEFIALLDADDIAQPSRFEKQFDFLNKNPDKGVCGTWFTFFGEKKNKTVKHAVTHDELKVQFLHSCGIGNPTVMFRKSALGDLRFEHQYVPAEDYGLWSQLLARTKFHNLPESLLLYRWHDSNISQTKVENLRKSERLIKIKQLEHLDISSNNPDIDYYLNAVSLKRKQSADSLIKTIKASHELLELNNTKQYYNPEIFKQHITRTIVRSIRNTKQKDMSLYRFVKNESRYFNFMSSLDKVTLLIKSLF
ncbi:glycosyltransferase [Hanstruepera ponticola]|uniref:glycosyltransferase n=1 Tax=Hanstruepera ponticola TaxID=2042995 RepID=UPI000CF0C14B|nr:glycosyltransferase [Hanstruepera ponticola]